MATTEWPVGHALAVSHWQRDLEKEALKRTSALQFMGKDSNSLLQIKDGPTKEAGDNVTWGLRMQLQGGGVSGDGTLEGKEEALVTYNDQIYVDQLRHAVRSSGVMSEQRVPFETRQESLDGLADWWADRFDTAFFNQIAGAAHNYTDTKYAGMQAATDAITASDTDHYHLPESQTTEAGVASTSASAVFKLTLLDRVVTKAKTISPLIRPINIMGGKYCVCFLHPLQVEDLRTNTDTGQWRDIQLSAIQGGDLTENPLFSGALGVYNKVILHENTRVPAANTTPSAGGVYRAIFCGAQAAALSFGKNHGAGKYKWVEEYFDYENQLGVAAGCIWGLKKSRYNSKDFGTILLPTYTTNSL
jgi:N4-gp56 family major capsid protein